MFSLVSLVLSVSTRKSKKKFLSTDQEKFTSVFVMKQFTHNTHAFELPSASLTRLKSPSTSLVVITIIISNTTIDYLVSGSHVPSCAILIFSSSPCSLGSSETIEPNGERPNHQLQDGNIFYSHVLSFAKTRQIVGHSVFH